MSAARSALPPPDMTGIADDWERARNARQKANQATEDANPQANTPATVNRDVTTPRRHDATNDSERGHQPPAKAHRPTPRRRPAPRAAGAVALTVRFDPQEATEVDQFILELRQETGQRDDKAEVVRELLRLAREHPGIRKALTRRLKA